MNQELDSKLFKEPVKTFKEHLALPDNERIIFSGKFGHGKTTFLQHFFDDTVQIGNLTKPKYNVIFLYPVNYSIASNEDIFRYIKYDIILEMLTRNYQLESAAKSYLETLPNYLKKNWLKVVATVLAMIPKVGKDVAEAFKALDGIKEEFFAFHDTEASKGNAGDVFANFLEKMRDEVGNLYEDDMVTKLIEQTLKEKLTADDKEENVLVIDDLDRIDPEHIFRILNVFAAHFDRRSALHTKNKFGFDKVILVCDINNIRNIFAAKYGGDTDFNGYIDKFYSKAVFKFNTVKYFQDFAQKVFSTISVTDKSQNTRNSGEWETFTTLYFQKNVEFLQAILALLFENRQINLRNIVKCRGMFFLYKGHHDFNGPILEESEFEILHSLRFLVHILGDSEALKAAIMNVRLFTLTEFQIRPYYIDLLYILTIHAHKNKPSRAPFVYDLGDLHISITGPTTVGNASDKRINISKYGTASGIHFRKGVFLTLLCNTIDFLHTEKYL